MTARCSSGLAEPEDGLRELEHAQHLGRRGLPQLLRLRLHDVDAGQLPGDAPARAAQQPADAGGGDDRVAGGRDDLGALLGCGLGARALIDAGGWPAARGPGRGSPVRPRSARRDASPSDAPSTTSLPPPCAVTATVRWSRRSRIGPAPGRCRRG